MPTATKAAGSSATHLVEFGPYFGVLLPSDDHEFFEPDVNLMDQGWKPLPGQMFDFGLRLGYFPSRFFGLEAEGGAMPGRTDEDVAVTGITVRGHVVGQLGLWRITPFILAGGGSTGVRSQRGAVGDDTDVTAHFGGGAKLYVNRWLNFRLDARDIVSAKRGAENGLTHNLEVLFGLGFVLGRPRPVEPEPAPVDSDHDGVFDPNDACPNEPAPGTADGCPIPDTDGDGLLDPDDACVDQPAPDTADGCPIPDTDGDGLLDPDDACPNEAGGGTADGCPIRDTDGDGLMDPDDKCVDQPETKNGFEDNDGCPDEVPAALEKFKGAIEGINFATGKATIRPSSFRVLDEAAAVLNEFEGVRIEVSGHTDNVGKEARNMTLSQERADAVKAYLVGKGVAAERIETRGAGPKEPVADNKSKKGRAQNRRIEFHVLSDTGSVTSKAGAAAK